MRDNQLESISITAFLSGSIFAKERSRAVKDLEIMSEIIQDSGRVKDSPSFNVGLVATLLTESIFAEARSRAFVTNIPSSDVENVCRDFLSEKADVKTILQADGNYTVEARLAN